MAHLLLGLLLSLSAPQVPHVATPPDVVDRMLRLASVNSNDVVYDLGCGDGRIVIAATQQFGARGVGVDIDQARIAEARRNAARAQVEHLVTFRLEDALNTDVSDATVVTLYLLSAQNVALRPTLTRQLRAWGRIVSHNFGMGNWDADEVDTFTSGDGQTWTLDLWNAPGADAQ